ncbi:ribosome maturation factor RimM [Azospirillum griseum]|uniref:Ribosome maturation factor RimM n=1 Tax=Azospirillum griseum TaxID=2496639 RepID=A0A431VGD7_9PROT|nr:ribosome maturation factor RimM [Azospirillum griseum]RTR19546.1 16S rRNA processing protein RimM [Azospirillum griseum]
MTSMICVGQFAGSHGVRGLVKLRSFTQDPADVAAYGPLADETGARLFKVTLQGKVKDLFLAKVEGITNREQAQALAGVRLHVDRAALPETEDDDSFYHADLIGLRAERADGSLYGMVKAIYDFGGGDVLEIRIGSGALEMLPFSKACVPVVDVRGGRIVVDLPTVIEAREGDGDGPEDGDEDAEDGEGEQRP